MSHDGTEPGATGEEDALTETESSRNAGRGATRGFTAQPLWLRLLLIVSVLAMVIGIVRCSIESTAPVATAVSSVAVMPVRVEAPEGFFTQPGDTVAVMAAKWFARSFSRASGIQVEIVRSPEDVLTVLQEDTPYDGLAYFSLERAYDEEKDEYRLLIHGEVVHSATKRPMVIVDYSVPPSFIYRRMTEAGEEVARRMGYASQGEAEGEE